MSKRNFVMYGVLAALGAGSLVLSQGALAGGGPFNMFNPSKWFGGNDRSDRYYDDYYYRDRYYGGPYGGYGYGPGWGGYGPYGGYPGWGGYGYPYAPQQQQAPAPERLPQ